MPTNGGHRHDRHEGHDMGRDVADSSTPGDQFNPENPGYETTDVNVSGIAVFLAGLFGSLFVFFFLCYGMGRVINNLWEKQDGAVSKWHLAANGVPPANGRRDLESNAAMQQEQLNQVAKTFPEPRLETDDSAHQVADLHAREDLMLEHYSQSKAGPRGGTDQTTYRIPIERAMELVAQRGLPVAQAPAGTPDQVAYAGPPQVKAPLTKGFARTAVELETIAAREQQMSYGSTEHTALMQVEPEKK
jgi:hypothetical protein